MEPTQTKPLRRRRRWLIVTFALVLVSLISWWFWPRGDARFVGKWEMIDDYFKRPFGTIRFYRNGSYRFWDTDQTTWDGTWRVEEGHFDMSVKIRPSEFFENEFLWQAAVQMEIWTGYQGYNRYNGKPFEIDSVTPNEIKLSDTSHRAKKTSKWYREYRYTYRRIAE